MAWLGVPKSAKELQTVPGSWYLGLVWGWKGLQKSNCCRSLRKHVREHESIALDHFTCLHRDGPREHGRVTNEGMEFPIFPAGVDIRRKSLQQREVVITTGKGFRELRGIDAGDLCFHARGDHIPPQLGRGNVPDGKQRFEPAPMELPHAVVANLLKEQVPEC